MKKVNNMLISNLKEFNCNGSVQIEKQIIKLSGDHRESCKNFFINEYICKPENIKIYGL